MPPRNRDIVVGRVDGPFGIRGELKLTVLTDFPGRFDPGGAIMVKPAAGRRRKKLIETCRPHKGRLLVKLRGVDSIADAEQLRNAEIVIDKAELAQLPDDAFYVFDIIGLKVITDDGREQGEVTEIITSGANDVYITSTGLCIPAVKHVVAGIDLKRGVMTIHPVPGLLPDDPPTR